MIRQTLLALSRSPTARRVLPGLPLVRRGVRRFMPGEGIGDAVTAAAELGARGVPTVLTLLGEDVVSSAEVKGVVDAYGQALEALGAAGVDAHVSVKPTQLGLSLGEERAAEGLAEVAALCAGAAVPLWIDMEGSATVDSTLRLYREVHRRHPGVGLCLQAALRRTPADLESLLPLEPRIRLVKGAYAEPPEVAWGARSEVDSAFLALALRLLEASSRGASRLVLGTHDEGLVEAIRVRAGGEGKEWEVHMLYGIMEGLQRRFISEGVPLRVLISYGPGWFPWYMRRLAERPANLLFAIRGLAR